MATVISENTVIIKPWPTQLDLLALHRLLPQRYPHLLASTSSSAIQPLPENAADRFDILMAFPQGRIELWANGLKATGFCTKSDSFLSALDECWQSAATENNADIELPFLGGWFIYLGYELAAEIEPKLNLPLDNNTNIPIAMAERIPLAIINDRFNQQTWLLCEQEYVHLLEELINDIARIDATPVALKNDNIELEEEQADKFIQGVTKVKDYIHEGDVFQVNLSRRWHGKAKTDITADMLFTRLARSNPAPYAGLASFNNASVISSSPERLVRVRQNRVETRPIAGTRPRGNDDSSDQQNLQELIGHPKERAEHVMLIDLERNDLGRICIPGTVDVNELMVLESYAHVHHIVSNVRGELQPGCSPADVIRAVFPGGTITGCPKVRCMEIIAELEQTNRGPYTGAMGYLNHNGDMDLNILIRTIEINKGRISFRAGAGLVADSIAERELEETRSKAKGMLLSLQGISS